MNKGLKAFKDLLKQMFPNYDVDASFDDICNHNKNLNIIKNTLKNYEELTRKPIILYERTHGQTQANIDMICKNYKEVKITCLEDEKKVKALEIIKEKKVNVRAFLKCCHREDGLTIYNNQCDDKQEMESKELTQEEYELLKEVLL